MKYLVQSSPRNKTYTYQRHWPTELRDQAKAAGYGTKFSMPTSCPIGDDEVEKALAQKLGNREWERFCNLFGSMDKVPTPIAETALKLFGHNIKQRKRKWTQSSIDRVKAQATLWGGLDLWLKAHPETQGKALADRRRYWSEWSEAIGSDRLIHADCIDDIHAGLDSLQEQMLARDCSVATVLRARNSVVAVLRWLSTEYRVGWTIEPRRLPTPKAKPKAVLPPEELTRLLVEVIDSDGPTAAMIALMLAGGIMPSEIGRLDPKAALKSLSATRPYLVIGHGVEVKADARRRIVPVVWPEEVMDIIRGHLTTAIERTAKAKDPSATVNKWLRVRDFGITGHGLRHTLAAVAASAMASPIALSRVAGWSAGGVSPIVLGYGSGLDDSEMVKSLYDECCRWWNQIEWEAFDSYWRG